MADFRKAPAQSGGAISGCHGALRAAPATGDQRRRQRQRGRRPARGGRTAPRARYPEALRRLGTRPRHAFARALLRDTRWDVAEAGPVPILGQPAPAATARELVRLRLRRAAAVAAARWASASIGGGLAGAVGGAVGGLILASVPDSVASLVVVPVLAVIGGCCGALAGAAVGAGLSVAESIVRSRRAIALICGAALGGGLAGSAAQWLADGPWLRWSE